MTPWDEGLSPARMIRMGWNTIRTLCDDIAPNDGAIGIPEPAHDLVGPNLIWCGAIIAADEAGQPLVG